jgi:FkbM family methyltransferase
MNAVRSIKSRVKSILPPKLQSAITLVGLWFKRATYRTRQVRHVYGGIPLIVELRDPDAAGWYDSDGELPCEIAFLSRHKLRKGARVFDIGAHQGIFAMMLAHLVAPGEVLAVEGNKFNASAAARNVELNGLKNACILHGVAAAEPGNISFSEGSNGRVVGNSAVRRSTVGLKVHSYSIDQLSELYGLPDVLFVDVEGYELEVLKGASKTLASHPDCFVEVHTGCGLETYGGTPRTIIDFFTEEAYELFLCEDPDKGFHPLEDRNHLPAKRFFLMAIEKITAKK